MLSVSVSKHVSFMYTRDLALHRSLAGSACARLEREEARSASALGNDGAAKGSTEETDGEVAMTAAVLGAARLRLEAWGAAVVAIEVARWGAAATAEADDEETEREKAAKKKDDDDNAAVAASERVSTPLVALPWAPVGVSRAGVGALCGIRRPLQADETLRRKHHPQFGSAMAR